MQPTPQSSTSYSVSAFTRDVKVLLESHFDWVSIEGEIGDFTAASSGHWYFTLKDSTSQVRCAMFRRSNARVKPQPQRGDQVQIRARVSLYEARGEFQLVCEHMSPAGGGALQLAFERLKKQLSEEGLFATERKQVLPTDVQRLAVITSASGAAIHDILSVLARRSPRTEVLLYPVPVQGEGAGDAIAGAIEHANRLHSEGKHPVAALVVGRGGGSLEDLWAFNEEVVARAIAASTLPVVSAVGHEVDFSIADFVADYRAATPSAAAEVLTADQREWQQRFDQRSRTITQMLTQRLRSERDRLEHLRRRLRHPSQQVAQQRALLQTLSARSQAAIRHRLAVENQTLTALHGRLERSHPKTRIRDYQSRIMSGRRALMSGIASAIARQRQYLDHQLRLLTSLGPQNTLNRGYAIVTNRDGHPLRSSHDAPPGEAVMIRLSDGSLKATVTEKSG